jgi:hypothetical protein
MLSLYTVKVWRPSDPRYFETIEVRTYTARRAQDLAAESFPGCRAHTLNVCVEGVWRKVELTHDSDSERCG